MALLGSSVDPRLFMQDYSGFTRAADIQSQSMQNLGQQVAGGIERYGEQKQERKKLDAGIKATVTGIESAIKMGDSLGIDVKSSLAPYLEKINDPNVSPIEAAAYAQQASESISNVLNFGMKANEIGLEKERYKQAAAARIAELQAEANKPGAIVEVNTPEGTRQMVRNPQTGALESLKVDPATQMPSTGLSGLPEPLKVFENVFIEEGRKNNIAPEILAAIAMHETGNGTSSAFRNKNNAMGISNASGPIQMGSVEESIAKMANLLGKGVNQGEGPYANAKSIEDIAKVYAPTGADNDPRDLNKFWSQGVARNIEALSKPTAVAQPDIGFKPSETKEVKVITGPEAKANGLDPAGTYEQTYENGKLTGITTITAPPTIGQLAQVKKSEAEIKASEAEVQKAQRSKDTAIKTISDYVDDEGMPTERLNKAVGYGEALATGIAEYAPILQTQSGETRSDQQRLNRLVETDILEAASLLKPVSNTDLLMLIKNRPTITEPTEVWTKYFSDIKGILSNPENYISSDGKSEVATPEKQLSANERLRARLNPQANR
jgi:hypothetical protein